MSVSPIFNNPNVQILPKQKEMFDKYCKILQWGRRNPTRFAEDFLNLQLTDMQKWIFLSSWVPSTVVWLLSRSSGKALALDTPVYTVTKDRGSEEEKYPHKTIGDLKLGDKVYGEDGKITEVIHINPIVIEDVYEVEFSDGEKIKCNGEHLWLVHDRNDSKCKKDLNYFVERNTDFIYSHINRSGSETINDYRFHVPNTKPVEYPNYQHLTIPPYVLGIHLGDGTKGLPVITSATNDVEETVRNLTPYCKTIIYKAVENRPEVSNIFIDREKEMKLVVPNYSNKKTLDAKLEYLGMGRNGKKFIPNRYLYSSVQNRLELLQGLMDTDGTVDKDGHCEFVQTDEILAKQVCQLIRSLGMSATLTLKEHTGYFKNVGTESACWRIYFTASKELPVFKMKRKYDRLPNHPLRGSDRKAIINIKRIRKKEAMRCITVNNDSGCFLIGNNYTVTHNSYMASIFLMLRALLFPKTNSYIMAPSGSQAQETFTKLENIAKNNIASAMGVTRVFLDETVKYNAKADPFVHNSQSYNVELYNGSTINTLNSVAKNIVGKMIAVLN